MEDAMKKIRNKSKNEVFMRLSSNRRTKGQFHEKDT